MNLDEIKGGDIYENKEIKDYFLYEFFEEINNINLPEIEINNIIDYSSSLNLIAEFISNKINNKLDNKLFKNFETSLFFSKNISLRIKNYLVENIFGLVLFSEYKLYCKEFIEETETKENLQSFIGEITNNSEWVEYFFEKYPVSYFLCSEIISNIIDYIFEILENIEKDFDIIKTSFKLEVREIFDLEILAGDLHQNSKSVTKINFINQKGNKSIILYKPKKLDREKLISKILLTLNIDFIKIPKIVIVENHSYVEFINHQNNESKISFNKTKNFFYKMGFLTGFLYQTNIEDIIYDNLIFSNDSIYLIDLESIFIPYFAGKTRLKVMEDSAIRTGVIPINFELNSFSMSPLLPQQKKRKIPKTMKNIYKGDKLFKYNDTNLPKYYFEAKEDKHVLAYNNNFNKGFEFFQNNYSIILSKILHNLRSDVKSIKSRILLRNSQWYGDVLLKSKSPKYLTSKLEYLEFMKSNFYFNENSDIEVEEMRQLLINDIPYFEISINNNSLSNGLGKTLPFHTKNEIIPANFSYKKFKENDNINYFNILFSYWSDKRRDSFDSIISKKLFSDCNEINDFFEKLAITNLYRKIELQQKVESNVVLIVKPSGNNLFDGKDGSIFYLLNLMKVSKEKQYIRQITKSVIKENIATFYINETSNNYSPFLFPFSTLVNHLLYENITGKKIDENFNNKIIIKFIAELKDLKNFDPTFLNGTSSAILFILNNKNLFRKVEIDLIIKNFKLGIVNYYKDKSKLNLNSWAFAGGHTGIIIVLNRLIQEDIKNEDLKSIYIWLENSFDNYISNNIKKKSGKLLNSFSWSGGIVGLIFFYKFIKKQDENYKKILQILDDNMINSNYSISNGNCGRKLVANFLYGENSDTQIVKLLNVSEIEYKTIHLNGLMNGVLGIGFTSLYLNNIGDIINITIPDKSFFKIN